MGIVDFSKSSGEARFHVVDLDERRSGELSRRARLGVPTRLTRASSTRFSNDFGSYATSNGAYTTGEYYHGKYGLSMKTHGLDWTNNNAEARAIVIHNAWYAEPEMLAPAWQARPFAGLLRLLARRPVGRDAASLAGGRMIYADKLA